MEKIVIIGAGGHARSVISSVGNQYQIVGIIDNSSTGSFSGFPIIGSDSDLQKTYKSGITLAHVAIGDNYTRKKLSLKLQEIGFTLVSVVDPTAIVCETAQLDAGVFVGKRAVVNANAKLGQGCIINSGAIIEHDCIINSYTHCAPGSVICGNVKIGDLCLVGANATVIPNIKIGSEITVGAGSTVISDLQSPGVYVGSPAIYSKKKETQ